MKRVGHLMEEIASLDNLYLAYHKACRGKYRKMEVVQFAEHFEENIRQIQKDIENKIISVGNYHFFTIHDPKQRIICAASFRERILHHAIMNVCHKYFDKRLIDTTYASRKGKGIYKALDKTVEAMSHYDYTVKLDVRKYYDSIDHGILKDKLRRVFKDSALLTLLDRIIDSYNSAEGKGLPIGNLISQYFANFYLSDLDHKAKEQWHAPIYIRYMDDIMMASNERESLGLCVRQLISFASEQLKLTFKPPIYRRVKDGQSFLGYKVMPYHYKLSGRSKKRFRTKLLLYEKLLNDNKWSELQYEEHILPLLSFVQHAESKAFRKACLAI